MSAQCPLMLGRGRTLHWNVLVGDAEHSECHSLLYANEMQMGRGMVAYANEMR